MKKNFSLKFCLTLLITLSLYVPLVAQTTYTSEGSGNWSNPSTWSPEGVPGSVEGDQAIINAEDTVVLDISPPQTLAKVTVESDGILLFSPTSGAKTLKTRDVEVKTGGTIDLIIPTFFVGHDLQITPLSSDPPNQLTTFQNNGSVDFNYALTNCVLRFTRNTKGPQRLIGTGATLYDLGPVVMENLSTVSPTTDFAPFAELDATQVIGEAGGSPISMQALLIDNRVGQVRGTRLPYTVTPTPPAPFFPVSYRYREDNPTVVLVNLNIQQNLFVQQGVMILNGNNGATLSHTIGNINIGSTNSIAREYFDSNSEQGARHNTGIALVSAANAFTNLTVTGNVTAPTLTHTDEGVVLALVSPASGNGADDASSSGAIMTVNGNFNLSGARLGLIGNGTNISLISADVRQSALPYRGGFANGTMRLEVKGNFLLKNTSRYNGRRGGGGSVPQIRFSGTSTQTFDAAPEVWLGTSGETNAITNWEIASGATVQMTSTSGIAIHNQFGLTVDGTLVCQDGAELIATLTGGGSGQTQLNMGPNGIIRVADVQGLGDGTLLDPASAATLFIRRTSPSSSTPNEWNLTSINTNGTIDYNGSALQVITPRNQQAAYLPNTQYHNLIISGGAKTLGATAVVNNQLTLNGGAVSGTTNDSVRVLNSATPAISRTSGWIDAPLERAVTGVGQQYFFPLGDAAVYRPITLQLTTSGTRVLAKLISGDANALAAVTAPLLKVSGLRYYEFNNLGSNAATMEQVLNMAINSDDAVNPANPNLTLKIATRTSGNWLSQGPSAVNTSALPTTFNSSSFTGLVGASTDFFVSLATLNPVDDPLPVELVEFVGQATGLGVELRWKTASERDNAGFVLLRNGQEIAHYRDVEALRGAGTLPVGRQYQFRDVAVREGERYVYRLRSVDFDGTTHDYEQTVEVEATRMIRDYELMQNYPNPFNPSTTIRYALPVASEVSLRVYDMLGRMVSEVLGSVKQEAGVYEVRFEARGLSSGVYFYRLEATSAQRRFVETKKMLLMK
ncbi:MAG: T9SS type A sorting domain-containing protein [Candidatus Thermochlorobacter sp.]